MRTAQNAHAGRPHGRGVVSASSIKELPLAIPPDAERLAIADFLDDETAKIDAMVAKTETAIARLHEYRSALITAAVTGKIDVRAASSQPQQEPAPLPAIA